MAFHSRTIPVTSPPRPTIECAQCGEQLFVPEWSEHVDDRRVRHVWNCEACRYSFETTVYFQALESA
jgi:ribosomal protein L37AE/L43A